MILKLPAGNSSLHIDYLKRISFMQRHIKIFIVLILLFILDLNTKAMLIPSALEENTGVSGTVFPNVPEPLHIDLVRPLGAKKGELEINTLGVIRLGDSNFSSSWDQKLNMSLKMAWLLNLSCLSRMKT